MQLSKHDLKQLDEETIRSLQADSLRTLSLKLLADLKEAHDTGGFIADVIVEVAGRSEGGA
jgi:hypothetical protein